MAGSTGNEMTKVIFEIPGATVATSSVRSRESGQL
jgi:hypothetical protein